MLEVWNKIKNYLLGVFGLLTGLFFLLFLREKKLKQVESALKENAETKGRVDQLDDQIKRIEEDAEKKENENVTKEDLLKFLNDSSNK